MSVIFLNLFKNKTKNALSGRLYDSMPKQEIVWF